MLWGNRVHKALELRIKGEAALPETMVTYEPLVTAIEAKRGIIDAEQKLALNADLEPTGYFAHDTWVRVITDFTVVKGSNAIVGDWKTGKPTPASLQLALCAAVTFAVKPYLEKIVTSFVWLQHGSTTNMIYTKADVPGIWQELLPRVARMKDAIITERFPPKPSGLCREWCPVPKRLCEHSGKS